MYYLIPIICLLICGHSFGSTYQIRSLDTKINITSEKVVSINGTISTSLYNNFNLAVFIKSSLPGDLIIIINSPGGDVGAGFRMVDTIRAQKILGQKVVCVVNGEADSMAFVILSSCDIRLATKKSKLMFHYSAYDSLESERGLRLTAKILKDYVENLEEDDVIIKEINNEALKLSDTDYEMYSDNSHIWSAQQLWLMGYLNFLVTIEKVVDDIRK